MRIHRLNLSSCHLKELFSFFTEVLNLSVTTVEKSFFQVRLNDSLIKVSQKNESPESRGDLSLKSIESIDFFLEKDDFFFLKERISFLQYRKELFHFSPQTLAQDEMISLRDPDGRVWSFYPDDPSKSSES